MRSMVRGGEANSLSQIYKFKLYFCIMKSIITKYFTFSPRIWLILFAVSILSVIDILGYYIEHDYDLPVMAGLICFASLKSTLFCMMLTVTRHRRAIRLTARIIIGLFILLSVINAVTYSLYGFGISRKLILILFESDSREMMEFIPGLITAITDHMFNTAGILTITLLTGTVLLIRRIPPTVFTATVITAGICGTAYIVWYAATVGWGKTNHMITVRTASYSVSVYKSLSRMRQDLERQRPLLYPGTARSDHRAGKLILIIGESASRGHHATYGYPLATTPFISEMSRDSMFVFTDAIASAATTCDNIPRILSFMSDEPGQREWYEYPTLLSLFRELGYRTTWISNQERTGLWSNLSGIYSAEADIVKYPGSEHSEDHLTDKYDGILLPELYDRLASPRDSLQLICMHLMGSHVQYHRRFPPAHAGITAEDILKITPRRPWLNQKKAGTIADYDNSIAYTDSIINEVIGMIAGDPAPAVMIYLSDHGEHVYDTHDFAGREPDCVEVPLYIYANKAYRNNNTDIIRQIAEAVNRPFSTADIIHTMISISGSTYELYDSARDLISPHFKPRIRYINDLEYTPAGQTIAHTE